ncbi:MAG: NAD(+)/NADH kinase [Coriobacteriia bacterium]|nr:NAD(+)/NADH kinase [Actinomycetota bacterium]MDZ4166243.1 NAD(+)/NADH kinase [Coriobacteriia bacterium]
MRILLVPNPANRRSVESVAVVSARLTALGYEPILVSTDAEACGVPELGVPRAEIGEPEMAVALGGDGTMLKTVHMLGVSEVPVLGINLGRLGFLSGADGDALDSALDAALAGEARVERRQTIEAALEIGGRAVGTYRALNEVFIGRGGGSRGVELELAVNGVTVGRYVCDGVIVATPTGSTAYALSAGGPLVSPDVRGMVLVPVAPHALGVRPMVLGPGDVVRVTCPNPARAEACVSVDGDQLPCRTVLGSVEVSVGGHDVRLMKLDGRDFYDVLAQTFLGA